MVLAATGIDHEELVKYAEPLLCDLPSVYRPKEPQSAYVGGDFRYCAATEVGYSTRCIYLILHTSRLIV